MGKDTETTIAGVVGALALLVQWILSTFFAYKLEIGADVLNAIAILAGLFVAYKVGKPNSSTLKLLLICILAIGFALPAMAQTWKQGSSITVAWDAVEGGTAYRIYAKPESGGEEELMATVTGTQGTATFTKEGRFFLGVSTVKTVGGVEVESATKCWSNDNTCTFQGVTFGLQNIVPPQAPKNFRTVN